MRRWATAAALLLACRGDHSGTASSGTGVPPTPEIAVRLASIVPKLPSSPPGDQELRSLDVQIERARKDWTAAQTLIGALIARAALTQRVEDYVEAVDRSAAWVALHPAVVSGWKLRITALSRVHNFVEARGALAKLAALSHDAANPGDGAELTATLDEATGHPERARVLREAAAAHTRRPEAITMLAANLALRGKLDESIALIPQAAAAVHDNSPVLFSWLLFQWGRLYEQKGDLGAARAFFAEAHKRLPSYLEATVHLAQAMTATGQDPSPVVAEALVAGGNDPHPELLALAGKIEDARRAWERYLAAAPNAFADHAARFYLGLGADPARALVLARANFANRDTPEARALAVEAALAAKQSPAACAVVDPLIAAPLRSQQFIAWRALSTCGRTADAGKLAAVLGIR